MINGCIPVGLVLSATWQKSSYSNPCGSCVEVAQLADRRIAVRNSRHPSGPALVIPRAQVTAFIRSTKVDGFDCVGARSMG
ncbi:MAG: DUF397 domain-containing protein [Pseudonocardiaceae bacterium]